VRVVLDINILISALILRGGTTDMVVGAWRSRAYTLLTCSTQIEELRACFARPKLAGDKAGLLALRTHQGARIVTARDFAQRFD
jgi:predicted nucleic acid-binding protein